MAMLSVSSDELFGRSATTAFPESQGSGSESDVSDLPGSSFSHMGIPDSLWQLELSTDFLGLLFTLLGLLGISLRKEIYHRNLQDTV